MKKDKLRKKLNVWNKKWIVNNDKEDGDDDCVLDYWSMVGVVGPRLLRLHLLRIDYYYWRKIRTLLIY